MTKFPRRMVLDTPPLTMTPFSTLDIPLTPTHFFPSQNEASHPRRESRHQSQSRQLDIVRRLFRDFLAHGLVLFLFLVHDHRPRRDHLLFPRRGAGRVDSLRRTHGRTKRHVSPRSLARQSANRHQQTMDRFSQI